MVHTSCAEGVAMCDDNSAGGFSPLLVTGLVLFALLVLGAWALRRSQLNKVPPPADHQEG